MELRTYSMPGAALVLALAVVATAALSPLLGVPVEGNQFAFDSGFAIASLTAFTAEIASGVVWPRWLHDGNFGLGSTTFYYYPPLSYWVAAAIKLIWDLPSPAALDYSVVLWRLAALATTFAWLRADYLRWPALAGAALAALFPYASVVNPWFRFAYAEVAAAALVPLLLLAIRRGGEGMGTRGLASIALAYAALAMTHLPTTTLAAVFGLAYAFGRGGLWLVLRTCIGGGIGALLAGAFLVPAFAMLHDAHPEGLYDFLGWPRPLFLDLPVGESRNLAPIYLAWFAAAGAVAWLLRGRWRDDAWRVPGVPRAALWLFLVTMVATTPVAWPIWMPGSPLMSVQFPWRVLVLTGPALGALAAHALSTSATPRGAAAVGVAFLLPFGLLWANIHLTHPAWPRLLPSAEHEAWALAASDSYPHEHWPAPAVAAGWLDPALGPQAGLGWPPPNPRQLPAEPLWRHRPPPLPDGTQRIRGGWWLPEAGPETFQLPQLWFPSWTAVSAQGPVELRASPETGFIEVHPGGRVTALRVVVAPTRWEQVGWVISGFGSALVVVALLLGRPWTRRSAQAEPA